MVFRAGKPVGRRGKVLFIDASEQIRVVAPRTSSSASMSTGSTAGIRRAKRSRTRQARLLVEEIAENDYYNLNIPLYVEKVIEDDLPSVAEHSTT